MSKPAKSNGGQSRRRAKVAACCVTCMPSGSGRADWEPVAAWVESVTCDAERDVRMLCVELVASHLRTGHMDVARMLQKLQQLSDFAMTIPESPASAPVPVPNSEDESVHATRQMA